MVVDEELKMMCDICHEGGQVLGPVPQADEPPRAHRVPPRRPHRPRPARGPARHDVRRHRHRLAGRERLPADQAVRVARAAATTAPRSRSSAATATGEPVVDSPIVIRTADVDLDGRLKVTAGATLVRDSDPAYEVAETHAKAGGILVRVRPGPAAPARRLDIAELVTDEDVLLALNARNRRLSTFWLTDQGGATPDPRLAGKSVVILDGEDDFVNMLRHVLGVLGMTSEVVRHEDYVAGCLDGFDLVIVGPGPGDPRDGEDPKMATLRAAVAGCSSASSRSSRSASATRRCATSSGSRCLQGHRLPGHAVAGVDRRPDRAGRLLQHLRRPGPTGVGPRRCRRGSRSRPTRSPATSTCSAGRTTAASSSTPSRSSPSTATT